MIHVRDLTVHYADQIALQDVSFDVRLGECLVVTGPSGCGKSTLVRVLTGLIPQVIPAEISGRVEVAGLDVTHCQTAESAQHVGLFSRTRGRIFSICALPTKLPLGRTTWGFRRKKSKPGLSGRWRPSA